MNRSDWLDLTVGRTRWPPNPGWDWEDPIFGWMLPDYEDSQGWLSKHKSDVAKWAFDQVGKPYNWGGFLTAPTEGISTLTLSAMNAPRLKVGDPIHYSNMPGKKMVGTVVSIDHANQTVQIRMADGN